MDFKRSVKKVFSLLLGVFGLVLILGVTLPIAINESKARQEYPDLLSPIPEEGKLSLTSRAIAQVGNIPKVLASELGNDIDYTDAANWFPTSLDGRQFATASSISYYTISIPKLNIDKATVAVGGEDLTDSIIHYPGTALPGKIGNSVLFGHSVLPYFFNPKNYISIFSTIDKLKKGDEITIDYDGITYTYRVKELFRVKPEDVYILSQNTNESYLSLVTCFPMGHPAKPERLVVKLQLVPFFK